MTDNKNKEHLFWGKLDEVFTNITKAFSFVIEFFKQAFVPPFHFHEIVHQCYEIGIKSLSLITLTGFVTGVVFTKQSRPSLEDFGATSWLPSLIGIAVFRALGPLVTAIICSGKVGSSIGAELGSMKVTEQIDAMEVSAINPFKYLVVTRVTATSVTIPILTFYCITVGLLGSFLNVHLEEATSFTMFFKNAFSNIRYLDLFTTVIKSIVYGFTIGIVGCYKGFNATKGTTGVGNAANHAVIVSMFLIFIEEMIIVQISNWFRV